MSRKLIAAGLLLSALAIPVFAKQTSDLNEHDLQRFVATAVRETTTLNFFSLRDDLVYNRDLFATHEDWLQYIEGIKSTPMYGEVHSYRLISEGQNVLVLDKNITEDGTYEVTGKFDFKKSSSRGTTLSPYTFTANVDVADVDDLKLSNIRFHPVRSDI